MINLGRSSRAAFRPSRIAGLASVWAIVLGGLALLGYALDLRILVRPVPGTALMAPPTAVAFIAAGVALWLVAPDPVPASRRRRAGQVLGLLVALLAVVVLAEYIFSRGADIDLVLFPGRVRAWAVNKVPGRPSPYSAVTLLFTGLSLALLDADPGHRHRPARVLVPATALITCVTLIGYVFGVNYRVDLARNGIEAVRLASAKSYQAILMDCQMPKMDGYTATVQVRQHERPGQHVPIIAMTAGALAEDKQRCLAAGMDDYLPKPIDLEQLRAALNRWAGTAPPLAGQSPITA